MYTTQDSKVLEGKVIVIDGRLPNRNRFEDHIKSHGGRITKSVSTKTDYLVQRILNSPSTTNNFRKARELGIQIMDVKTFQEMTSPKSDDSQTLEGKVVVASGKLTSMIGKQFRDYVKSHGGRTQGTVSPKTDYLVQCDLSASSETGKSENARELNIPILTETTFFKMILPHDVTLITPAEINKSKRSKREMADLLDRVEQSLISGCRVSFGNDADYERDTLKAREQLANDTDKKRRLGKPDKYWIARRFSKLS